MQPCTEYFFSRARGNTTLTASSVVLTFLHQDFFYHVLLVLDSHTFNSHLKAELVAEIARLYQQQASFTTSQKGGQSARDDGVAGSSRAAGEGVSGFTGTMVKLKVPNLNGSVCESGARGDAVVSSLSGYNLAAFFSRSRQGLGTMSCYSVVARGAVRSFSLHTRNMVIYCGECQRSVVNRGSLCWFISQVLAKFLGLLTFRPNWGVPASDAPSTTYEPPIASGHEKVRHKGKNLGAVGEGCVHVLSLEMGLAVIFSLLSGRVVRSTRSTVLCR